jgi:hypothetical protein
MSKMHMAIKGMLQKKFMEVNKGKGGNFMDLLARGNKINKDEEDMGVSDEITDRENLR